MLQTVKSIQNFGNLDQYGKLVVGWELGIIWVVHDFIQGLAFLRNHMNWILFVDVDTDWSSDEIDHFEHVQLRQLREIILKLVCSDSFKVHDSAYVQMLILFELT